MTYTQQPPVRRKKVWPWVIAASVAALLILVALCAGLLGATGHDDPPTLNTPTAESVAGNKPKPTTAPKPVNGVDEGEWLVGEDVAAGTYRTDGALDSAIPVCIWTVWTNDDKADVVAVGSADKANQPGRVVLKKGQVFSTSGCKRWLKQH